MVKNEIFEFYFITITYKSVNIHNSALIETMGKKVSKFHYFSLCVRLRIVQIGTHLKIVPNRYISHHYFFIFYSGKTCIHIKLRLLDCSPIFQLGQG